ncbi:hypothetical protein RE474_04935 [Methanolobus sediminis]|uniref:Uncharacterized protein n=1 Tax=Methanolobus sediminis TaxID=3072978 RepID=A0AA51UMG5_9EURY|nr:hypothetical protein [Methanolobus sediminis]WMW26070.1 hypothetical protein RE474_04935 [Methanolobus sediminis]
MKHKILKVLACISLIAMVFGAVTPGAFADETGTSNDTKFDGHNMMHAPDGNFSINNSSMAEPVFDSEEEEMIFLVERTNESVSRKIEMLQGMLDNIDEIDDENVTADSIQEQITELQALLADVESTTTLDELKGILETARGSMMTENPGKGERPEMEKMVFDSDEEEMQYLVERETEHINKRIEMLNEKIDNIDEINDENVTEESINEEITGLENLLADIQGATTLDELKEILEEYRESNPHPRGHGGEHGPMSQAPELEEEVTTEE